MKVAFDTSVIVAASLEIHPFHPRAICWVEAASAKKLQGLVSWHGIAETWSVLTRFPVDNSANGAIAERMIDRLLERLRPLPVSAKAYRYALRRCSDRALRSGAIFDALHLVSAEIAGADIFLTLNSGDFERLRLAKSPRIVTPPDPPRVSI